MPDWTDREEAPELGPGWVRMSKKRPDGQQGAKQVDHIWISPEGRRFRSLKNAHEHLSGYPVGQVAAPAKEKPKKKAKPKSAVRNGESMYMETDASSFPPHGVEYAVSGKSSE